MSLIIDEDLMTDVEPILVIRLYFTRLFLCDMCKIKTSPAYHRGKFFLTVILVFVPEKQDVY